MTVKDSRLFRSRVPEAALAYSASRHVQNTLAARFGCIASQGEARRSWRLYPSIYFVWDKPPDYIGASQLGDFGAGLEPESYKYIEHGSNSLLLMLSQSPFIRTKNCHGRVWSVAFGLSGDESHPTQSGNEKISMPRRELHAGDPL